MLDKKGGRMPERVPSPFTDAAFTPDGSRLLTCDYLGRIVVRDPASLESLTTLSVGKPVAVYELAVTADSRYAVAACFDGTVRICDLHESQKVRVLEGHLDCVLTVALTPDGRHIVSGGRDKRVHVWDLATGETVRNWWVGGIVHGLAVAPEGDVLAVCGPKGAVHITDLDSGRRLGTLRGHDLGTQSVRFTPDGRRVVTGDAHGSVRVWDRGDLGLLRTLDFPGDPRTRASDGAMRLVVTPDGSHVVVRHQGGDVVTWEIETGRPVDAIREGTTALTLTPDGTRIFLAGPQELRLAPRMAAPAQAPRDPAAASAVRTRSGWTFSLSVGPDGQTAVVGGSDGVARGLDLSTGARTVKVASTTGPLTGVAHAPDGSHLVTAGRLDKGVHVWSVPRGSLRRTLDSRSWVQSIVVTGRGWAVAGCTDGKVRCWDLASGKLRWSSGFRSVASGLVQVMHVQLTPDEAHVVAGTGNGRVVVIETDTGKRVGSSAVHRWDVAALAVHPGGGQVVSASAGTVRLTELATGREIRSAETGLGWVADLAVTRDGSRVLVVGADERVLVWDLADGAVTFHDVGHTSPVTRIAALPVAPGATGTPGAERYVTAGDHALRLWDLPPR